MCAPRRRCPLAADAVIRDDDEHVLDAAAEGGDLDLERAAEEAAPSLPMSPTPALHLC